MIKSHQRYISRYLTHFVGRELSNDDDRYSLFSKILKDGWPLARNFADTPLEERTQRIRQTGISFPYRIQNIDLNQVFVGDLVCFADIPVNELTIHLNKYSSFGISFNKGFLVQHGANPVYYVSSQTVPWGEGKANLQELYREMMQFFINKQENRYNYQQQNKIIEGVELEEHKLLHYLLKYVFSNLKFWDHSLNETDSSNYYLEREWRIWGGVNFHIEHVARIFLPESFSPRFREDFPKYSNELFFTDSSI